MVVWNFIISNIFQNPPVLLGLIAAIGLILQRKGVADIIKGSLLTAFGMVILTTGVNMLVGVILPVNSAFQGLTGASAGDSLNADSFTSSFGSEVGMAMLFGLILHVLIARFTPIKTIFLTGHMIWWFPFIFVAAAVEGGLGRWGSIATGAVAAALYWSLMPWALRKYVFKVIGDESFTLGHPTGFLSLISGFVASKVGNPKRSTEDLNLPKGLSFFREISITGGIVLFIVFIVVGLLIPNSVSKDSNLATVSITNALNFGAGLIILLSGVRLLISQIVPAFKGISEKVVPNALPAFDCPVIFSYRPNAVLIGFLTAMVTSTVLVLLCNGLNVFHVILIPLVITSFFECGTAAVIGEGQGGLRGSIIGTAVAAVFMVAAVGLSAIIYATTIQNWILIFGGNDFSLFGPIVKFIAQLIHMI